MIERAKTGGLKKLWIILLLTVSTQCMWITSYAIEINETITNEIITKEDNSNTKCLKLETKVPYITSSYGILVNELIGERVHNFITEVNNAVEEFGKVGPKCPIPYEFIANYSIERNDENILSLCMKYYQFTGGAHGMSYNEPYTVNKKTGEILTLKNLFNEGYDYKTPIDSEIRKQIAMDKEKYFAGADGFKGIDSTSVFYLTEDSLVIVYGLYEIAPYASGIIEFKINLNEFKDGLKYGNI